MIKRKVCMLGTFSVGKTSLVRQFVESIFSEKYHTTIGVKIDKKTITLHGQDMMLMLWDIEGEDKFYQLKQSYLRGLSGYLLVADGTRPASLDAALDIKKSMDDTFRNVPHLLVLNKSDLKEQWAVDSSRRQQMQEEEINVIQTSAKTGENVEDIFLRLGSLML